MQIRRATRQDIPEILALIVELADYERAVEEAKATPEQLEAVLFGDNPSVFCEMLDVDGEVAGFALWFLNFSTWTGSYGIYLEDLFIRPAYRHLGYATALLRHLATECVNQGYARFQWSVLDWNEPAISFYKSIGAWPMDEWTTYRLAGEALEAFARGEA
jgi:GNAT superfamily N-acetyltransferase